MRIKIIYKKYIKINILKMETSKESKKFLTQINSLHCNLCNSPLVLKYLNQFQQITLCSNKLVSISFLIFNKLINIVLISIGSI